MIVITISSCGILGFEKDPIVARVRLNFLRQSDIAQDLGHNINPQLEQEYIDRWVADRLWRIEARKRVSLNHSSRKKLYEYKAALLVREYREKYILNNIMVSENDVIDYYEKNQQEFKTQSKAVFLQIYTTNSANEANAVLSRLKKNEDPVIGGQLILAYPGTLIDILDDKVFSRDTDDIIGPISQNGLYYVVSVIHRYAENSMLRVEHVRGDIIQKLRMSKYASAVQNKEKELKEKINVKIFKNTDH